MLYPCIILLYNPLPTSSVSLFHSLQRTPFLYISVSHLNHMIPDALHQSQHTSFDLYIPTSITTHYPWHLYTRIITFNSHLYSCIFPNNLHLNQSQHTLHMLCIPESSHTSYSTGLYIHVIPSTTYSLPLYPQTFKINMPLYFCFNVSQNLYPSNIQSFQSCPLYSCTNQNTLHLNSVSLNPPLHPTPNSCIIPTTQLPTSISLIHHICITVQFLLPNSVPLYQLQPTTNLCIPVSSSTPFT